METQPSSTKVVEQYMDALKLHQQKLKKDKVTVLMQVGDFLEIYGLIYPDGSKEGNIWEFCDNVNLRIGPKAMKVYNNPAIEVYMGGVQPANANTYIQKAVDKFGWTVVIYEQERIGNSKKFERKESSIISPGININSDNFSNTTMVIYLEQVKNYISLNKINEPVVNIGLAFIDCITGENGIMAINNNPASDLSIALDELLKLLTIKNPNELEIYISNVDITDDDLVNSLHLFNHQFKIIREPIDEKFEKLRYQHNLLDNVYTRHRGINDILQQLDIEDQSHYYSRIALCILIEYILNHDKTIIEKLEKPEIIINSDKYLMLANNCLEQLDIIDNLKSIYNINSNQGLGRRKSLLELLDNTKTPLGRIKLRQRLSIPITDTTILIKRYNNISEFIDIHSKYLINKPNDKNGSPIFQIRRILGYIKNIDNYLRKIITGKITPIDIESYIESLSKCLETINYYKKNVDNNYTSLYDILPNENTINILSTLIETFKKSLILENCRYFWSDITNNIFVLGVSQPLDDLQKEIDLDRTFVDSLIKELTSLSDKEGAKTGTINMADNATSGIHIYTTTSRKDILENYFSKQGSSIIVGKQVITGKDIKFLKMKESKWQIDVPYLKISSGTLKSNLEQLIKLVKVEFIKWCHNTITNNLDILECLNNVSVFIAELDLIQSNTLNAINNGYCKPIIQLKQHSYLDVKQIRHPIIEQISTSTKYVPNDIKLGLDNTSGILLFGVNAVGKSSLMKSIGINIIMAQAGMFVSATEFVYHPYKYLFTRIRNNDNLYAGLSSFEVEMKEFKVILKYANENSIILGDELAAGTSSEDATALVASGVGQLSKRNSSFLFATHLHFLAQMPYIKSLTNVKLFHLLVEKDPTNPKRLIYNRKILEGNGPKSYGILVCESMGLDDSFIEKAKELRSTLNIVSDADLYKPTESKYNHNKLVTLCEVCNDIADDVHHINQQCTANEHNLIHSLDGIFHKNKLWNLVSLCKSCHQNVHSEPPKLTIQGYVQTNTGIILQYNKGLNNIKEESLLTKTNNIDINNTIIELANKKYSPKKIQYDLKKNYNIDITQQYIRQLLQ